MQELRVLVCGGREYKNNKKVYEILDLIKSLCDANKISDLSVDRNKLVIIQGGANGADRLASSWAKDRNVEQEEYPADWNTYGRAAGFIRNSLMLKSGKPDMVIAFPGNTGTKMMISLAQKAGIPVEVIED
jgi:predicted Rossmann-fold nucleotide-binding protein